ncbi:MAG: phosphoglycerol geranylgeranyltransferase [Candidatus Methanomethylophilaceae archaeon]|nr:phosphoglycerol geranylgeranyltransferase [Candidatus Methanomethylophilaceae archaeon]MDI3542303.1 phosphoglycerol geranylgeranyltransferase [Candidatus Methanomethylophilaceae archaeon]HIJ00026.1 geranylgeranylglyceryl/heptaprenylglyceryl phosphate synthase [Candidatus Methanomethylophilaceae archaeon]
MTVKEYLLEKMSHGTIHMTLIDPAKQPPELAARIAADAEELGTTAIMIGGSTDVTQENLDKTALAIKDEVKVPLIYFPSGANAISPHCDAIYFMSMLNSRDPQMIIREQARGAPIIKKLGLEPISMGYIIIEPGMKVGEVGKADVIKRFDIDEALSYALAADLLGMSMVYLEAGSGADRPVPLEMISKVRDTISVPLIVGGGIKSADIATKIVRAGANAVVTGTVVESDSFRESLREIITSIRSCT